MTHKVLGITTYMFPLIDFDMLFYISLYVLIVVMVTNSWSLVQEAMTAPFVFEPLNVQSKAH